MVIIKLMGGLGNQMFQYAIAKSLAHTHGTTFKLDLDFLLDRTPKKNLVFRDYDLTIFSCEQKIANREEVNEIIGSNIFSSKIISKLLPIRNRKHYRERFFNFDEEVFQTGNSVYLDGYWQSPKYFERVAELIRVDFAFNDMSGGDTEKLKMEIISNNSVCVNVRRGDFLINSFHGSCSLEYYSKGVEYIAARVCDLNIYVFSDDIPWCRENMVFKHKTIFVDHEFAGNKFQDYLMLMTMCKHFVIPNSTFAWWGAWLCDYASKIVVSPTNWFTDININTNDLIPSDWIRMNG